MTSDAGSQRGIEAPGRSGLSGLDGYLVPPACTPPLDAGFRPAVLARAAYETAVRGSRGWRPAWLAVEQPGGAVSVREVPVFEEGHPDAAGSVAMCERTLKTLLWSRGGARVWVDGPSSLAGALRRHYETTATGRFDASMMGRTVYGLPFEVVAAPRAAFPEGRQRTSSIGRHLDGCRIGFDLGASDRKAAAVIDGRVVFSEEIAWDPSHQPDPGWHYDQITDSLRRAAAHLPRVDAIGGSAAGIYVDNRIRAASLFRAVSPDAFRDRVAGLFLEIRAAWGGIPFVVVNDGDVTALAGSMLAGVGAMLGVAMGSSEAAGYVTPDGGLTSWLNELAFAPIDLAPDAPVDEWSGDRGCGVQYLSQQALGRLLPAAGIEVEQGVGLPERLVRLQRLMADGDERAGRVYETIGTYLGYALLEYRTAYQVSNVLLLGRVMTGEGGDVILARAGEVLRAEDPAAADSIAFHAVSERDKRHGQAVAAASLPALPT